MWKLWTKNYDACSRIAMKESQWRHPLLSILSTTFQLCFVIRNQYWKYNIHKFVVISFFQWFNHYESLLKRKKNIFTSIRSFCLKSLAKKRLSVSNGEKLFVFRHMFNGRINRTAKVLWGGGCFTFTLANHKKKQWKYFATDTRTRCKITCGAQHIVLALL